MKVEELGRRGARCMGLDWDYDDGLYRVEKILHNRIRDNFHRAQTAHGSPWKPRKDTKPHPLLILTGRLATAAQMGMKMEGQFTLHHGVLVDIPYAAVHQWGSRPGSRPQIPARKYMDITDEDINEMADRIADFVIEQVEERL